MLERYPDFCRRAMLLNAHFFGILPATYKLTYDFIVYTEQYQYYIADLKSPGKVFVL